MLYTCFDNNTTVNIVYMLRNNQLKYILHYTRSYSNSHNLKVSKQRVCHWMLNCLWGRRPIQESMKTDPNLVEILLT